VITFPPAASLAANTDVVRRKNEVS
jgi:hypothetical protein